ncbi:MAG: phage holin family protein [Bacteroidetes bacterium]|nr:phage holin family protein [Bacteroidota bacterium]MBS1933257.1 phage holin family protein [Bacteroidota bacterium]
MQDTFTKIEELAGHIKEYVDNRVASAKLNTAEKTSTIVANIIARLVVMVIAIFFILFLSISAALALGKLTGENYWGYLIISGVYLLIALMVWAGREKLLRLPVMNAMLRKLFNDENESNE